MAAPWRFLPCPNCCQSPCVCCSGDVPAELQAVISGMTDGNCADCDTLNDTYILGNQFTTDAACYWYYELPTETCTFLFLVAKLVQDGDNCVLRVFFTPDAVVEGTDIEFDTDCQVWEKDYTGSTDCAAWVDEELGRVQDTLECWSSTDPILVSAV